MSEAEIAPEATGYPPGAESMREPRMEIAGFWRRLAAFAIDGIALGVTGALLGWFFFDQLARMGGFERLFGFALAMVYAGVLNSRIGGGQTLGKKTTGIRVLGRDGEFLSLPRAAARQCVFSLPLFLNGAPFGLELLQSALGNVLSLLVFGGLFAIVYLFAFNRRTRQSLHDLVVDSYVARAKEGAPRFPLQARIWRPHLALVAAFAVASLLAPTMATHWATSTPFAELLPVQQSLAELPDVQNASVVAGWSKRFGSADQTTYTTVSLRLSSAAKLEDAAYAETIARLVMAKSAEARSRDLIVVNLSYGYDMVIASGWRSQSWRFRPGQLR